MAEVGPVAHQSLTQDVEVKTHLPHTNEFSGGDSTHLNKKSQDKHPPNGLNRISSETNGLIDHVSTVSAKNKSVIDEVIKHEIQESRNMCCNAIECQSFSEQSCDRNSDKCVSELESDVRLLNVQDHISKDVEQEHVSKDVDHYNGIEYVVYKSELQMPDIMRLITKDLSEPYSIYTYRYFIHNWPKLCFLAMDEEKCVGAIVCKLDMHKKMVRRGYIAMLAVDSEYRRKKIGSHLVLKAIKAMIADDCDEVVLETEITNQAALRLYENLGFVRDKRLFRYYLNGVDALRLKLWLR